MDTTTPIDQRNDRYSGGEVSNESMGLWALLCGVGGLVLMFVPCLWLGAIIPNIFGVVLGGITLSKTSRNGQGMAKAGIVCGLIGGLLYLGMWLMWQDAVTEAFGE